MNTKMNILKNRPWYNTIYKENIKDGIINIILLNVENLANDENIHSTIKSDNTNDISLYHKKDNYFHFAMFELYDLYYDPLFYFEAENEEILRNNIYKLYLKTSNIENLNIRENCDYTIHKISENIYIVDSLELGYPIDLKSQGSLGYYTIEYNENIVKLIRVSITGYHMLKNNKYYDLCKKRRLITGMDADEYQNVIFKFKNIDKSNLINTDYGFQYYYNEYVYLSKFEDIIEIGSFFPKDLCNKYMNILDTAIKDGTNVSATDALGVESHEFDDNLLADMLYEKLKPIMKNMHSVYNKFNMMKYGNGTDFRCHVDSPKYVDDKIYGKYRILIYLNDTNYGGITYYYINGTDSSPKLYYPEMGKVIIFDMDIKHGSYASSKYKYILAGDIMVKYDIN